MLCKMPGRGEERKLSDQELGRDNKKTGEEKELGRGMSCQSRVIQYASILCAFNSI